MDILAEIKRDMAFMGWQGPPDTGFTYKRDADGNSIARAHDATWQADYVEAEARVQREAKRRERESWERCRVAYPRNPNTTATTTPIIPSTNPAPSHHGGICGSSSGGMAKATSGCGGV